ncbi:MAG: zinc-ribbon domain-containing protein [Thermoguttaceae bacterium]|nr:zinc-ribbon domain-containing protein [Thermoguttaceae bacterium]
MSNSEASNFHEQIFRCPRCGAEVSSNSQFCNYCGVALPHQESFGLPPTLQNTWGNQTPYNYSDLENPYASPQAWANTGPFSAVTVNRQVMSDRIKSTWFLYLLFWLITLFGLILVIVAAIVQESDPGLPLSLFVSDEVVAVVSLITAATGFVAFINALVLLHHFWSIVPRDMAVTTPGHAVGFLFFPLFNIYWVFVAYLQLARHYRDLTRGAGFESGHETLAICRNVSLFIPYVSLILGPILNFFLLARFKTDALFILEQYPEVPQNAYAQNQILPPPYPNENTEYSLLLPVNTSVFAIVAGYLGLISVLVFPAPFAILFGWLALCDLDKHPGTYGYGRAWFGIVAGSLVSLGVAAFLCITLIME